MNPSHLINLMCLIDCSEDEVQIEKWGRQTPLLRLYAHDRKMAIAFRRVGKIEKALIHERRNDARYNATMRVRDFEGG